MINEMINTSRLKCVTSYFLAFLSALNAAVSLFRCIHETESAAASCRQATVNEFAQPHRLHLPVSCYSLRELSFSFRDINTSFSAFSVKLHAFQLEHIS